MAASISSDAYRDSRFCCNICLEPVVEPVVTHCGHLFCWPCLFRWLEPGMTPEEMVPGAWQQHRPIDNTRRTCPVCKTTCTIATVVPIYVRTAEDATQGLPTPDSPLTIHHSVNDGGTEVSTGQQETTGLRRRLRFQSVPARPTYGGSSREQVTHESSLSPSRTTSSPAVSLSTGLTLSLQQALFGYNTAVPPLHRQMQPQEQDPATEFLSRLLLMLGSFVILCLLLF